MKRSPSAAWIAWLLAAFYYFFQYALRSAPSVMVPQLSDAFQLTALGVASLVGLFYYGYAPFSLIAGTAIDRLGPRLVVPAGAFITGIGAILFGTGDVTAANIGRALQGIGGGFALVGAVYIVGKSFPPSSAATLIGATQMFGMAGGSAGQFVVGKVIAAGVPWNSFWIVMGIAGVLLGVCLFVLLPGVDARQYQTPWLKETATSLAAVFKNPQSILCGVIAGLLFIPTTIFDMIFGVRFLQEARQFDYAEAVLRSSMVPLGWIIGCPLLGWLSDKVGRRKPVIAGGGCVLLTCLAWMLFGNPGFLPPYVTGLVAGIASGASMLTYTVIKEANPPQYGGTAAGANSFMNLGFSALLGPVFGGVLESVSEGKPRGLEHYQMTFQAMLYGVAVAVLLTFLLKETGPAARLPQQRAKEAA
jgi:MFS family permease